MESLAPGTAAAFEAEKVPALDEGLEVVLVRTGEVLGELVELVGADAAGGVTVAVVLGLTPATEQYWDDWAWYCFPWSTSSAQPL